ncbi:Nif3-like dinuclear metal center hexameric protein [Halothermothrix orenii]|uniref:GTP cyclohydrolase 1 type 2 homolog n=1 Tax=Halothermothrix orenii (strain H 168 / OCM 544 / DSM 9562) TaxID=373903 RepID=B8CXH0_HALOH|nr:Nif3-like dinuclear metal center hexameric protein [Halothermothrix orenii]ACL69989.1 conserved hypothetical protein TIGR00486 [Halothermothrix orenii H 168]
MVRLSNIVGVMNEIAPRFLAMDWDNPGLQIGYFSQEINRVLVTLDVTEEVVEEAIEENCQLIISHHPLLFKGLKSIHDKSYNGRVVLKAIKNNIAVLSAHTNFDIVGSGINDYLSHLLGLSDIQPLKVTGEKPYIKLVVFIPESHFDVVRKEILDSGLAGFIGNYSHTSFSVKGEGTFKPLEGSNPFTGQKGHLARVEELRLETIIPANNISKVIDIIKKVHPYEEVAYDLYPLNNTGEKYGLGRIGLLEKGIKLVDFVDIVKEKLGIRHIRYTGNYDNIVKRIAVCSGSGGDLIREARNKRADLYITGDIKYHDAQLASELGLAVVDAGHYGTEKHVKSLLVGLLTDKFKENGFKVGVCKSRINTNPWLYK